MMGYKNFLYETDDFYEWIDEGLWADKDFVMEAMDVNADLPIRKISKEIIADKEFLSILEKEYYMHGLGCEMLESDNVDRALICIEYDAEKGNKEAQIHLSELYSDGKYIEKSLEKAEKWRKIADQN